MSGHPLRFFKRATGSPKLRDSGRSKRVAANNLVEPHGFRPAAEHAEDIVSGHPFARQLPLLVCCREQWLVFLIETRSFQVGVAVLGGGVVGVADSTLRRWLADSDFRADYAAARRTLLLDTLRDMQRSVSAATDALRLIVADNSKPAAARVSAARTIIDAAFRGTELLDLAEGMATLEEKVADMEADRDAIPAALRAMSQYELTDLAREAAERKARQKRDADAYIAKLREPATPTMR